MRYHAEMLRLILLAALCTSATTQRVLSYVSLPASGALGELVRNVGDVDLDGLDDFLVSDAEISDPSTVYVVSSASGQSVWSFVSPDDGPADGAGIGDVNGDGRSDIAFVSYDELRVLSGLDGSLILSQSPTGSQGGFVGVAGVEDVNGNGSRDIALTTYTGGNCRVWFQDGVSAAPLGNTIQIPSNLARCVIRNLGVPDGSSYPSVAMATNVRLTVVTSNPVQVVQSTTFPNAWPDSLAGIDIDGDGDRDPVFGRAQDHRFEGRRHGDGALLFTLAGPWFEAGVYGRAVSAVGDLDADGTEDFAIGLREANSGRGAVLAISGADRRELWRFDGLPTIHGCGADVMGLGDIDGDGFGDLAVGCRGGAASNPPPGGWIVLSGKPVADIADVGGACGGGPFLPELGTTRWLIGQDVTVVCRDGTAGALGVLGFGVAPELPFHLGVSTCQAAFDPGAWVGLHETTLTDWTITFPLPGVPQLAGIEVALQAIYNPTNGPLGIDLSNGLWARIGY